MRREGESSLECSTRGKKKSGCCFSRLDVDRDETLPPDQSCKRDTRKEKGCHDMAILVAPAEWSSLWMATRN